MPKTRYTKRILIVASFIAGATSGGGLILLAGQAAIAAAPVPTEHKGLTVEAPGAIGTDSMKATLGLEGHKLQLRLITIDPGGHIAKHSHETRPGLVKVIDGEWVEGRPTGETSFTASTAKAITEDEKTTHWFFNRGEKPATAVVCDIVPDR